jgi:monoamine oxidase
MPDDVDIAVIGAGAAGLAAARALQAAPVSVLVLEARRRIGGRARTVTLDGQALDLGCGWLHSADVNLFSDQARALGFALDKTPPHWTRPAANPDFAPAAQARFAEALETLEARIDAAAQAGLDQAVSTLMTPGDPWNPLLDAFSAFYNGAEFDRISTRDYAAYQDSGVNWRLPGGYGALIAAFGATAPVMLDTPVSRLDHHGPRLHLETPRGTLSAAAAIVTVPTPHLADGDLGFSPDLPEVREAAAALPLGLADKLFLRVDGPEALAAESHLFGDPARTATGSYHLRPFGRPLIEAYFGGRHAEALERQGSGAAAAFAIEELVNRLGSSLRSRLAPIAGSAWLAQPWSRGAYSHAMPGGAWARAALARPIDDRIFLAGEAVSPDAFSTAHGAAATGIRAAGLALQALGRAPAATQTRSMGGGHS